MSHAVECNCYFDFAIRTAIVSILIVASNGIEAKSAEPLEKGIEAVAVTPLTWRVEDLNLTAKPASMDRHSATCFAAECGCNGPGTLEFFAGIEGSKQPQDFGANANLGGRAHLNWGRIVMPEYGLGVQLGTAINATGNAVRVFELLGESTGRTQSFTTTGIFQRTQNGIHWGIVYDFLYQESFDQFFLGQWRGRLGYDWGCSDEIGVTVQLSGERESGLFNGSSVTLDPITQGSFYWRHHWETGIQTTIWAGLAEGHGESNPITGFAPPKDEVFVFGADILAPLNDYLALYGETNLMMPADTGAVDAYLGLQWSPWGGAKSSRRSLCAPLLPVAASTSFSVDLMQ